MLCFLYLKSRGFKDFKYDMDMDIDKDVDMEMVDMDMDKQGLGPKGSSVDSILSFFYFDSLRKGKFKMK